MAQWTLTNPDFETGSPGASSWGSGWTLNDTNTSVTISKELTIVHGGASALKMVDANAGEDDFMRKGSIEEAQFGAAVIGVTYTLSAWVNCTAFTAAALSNRGLGLLIDSAVTSSDITAATSGWEQRTVTHKATTTAAMTIRLYSPQGTIYWDDIVFSDDTGSVMVPVWPRVRFNG